MLENKKLQSAFKLSSRITLYVPSTVTEVLEHPGRARDLLPTRSGFFFGGTDYYEYYAHDFNITNEILTEVLQNTDFETQIITYTSSW